MLSFWGLASLVQLHLEICNTAQAELREALHDALTTSKPGSSTVAKDNMMLDRSLAIILLQRCICVTHQAALTSSWCSAW